MRAVRSLQILQRPYFAKFCAKSLIPQLVRTLRRRLLESDTVTARLSLILNIIICFQA